MAEAAMAPHAAAPLPRPGDHWRDWFLENTRGFRRTLLMHRDGARRHAGSVPGGADLGRMPTRCSFCLRPAFPKRTPGWQCRPPAATRSAAFWKSKRTPPSSSKRTTPSSRRSTTSPPSRPGRPPWWTVWRSASGRGNRTRTEPHHAPDAGVSNLPGATHTPSRP
ncbi:TetR/AcrR family transcriptional regulator C-terminal domain-containing protein [Embleya sp. MST-111070]|uniref:TetR/AcrR family transcriptional regulator C-terminal domain-containing protein n=1 Tax=Embleya sp. MST-111070 TaxID=3398231 RepID=UPI003F73D9D9